MTLRSRFNSCHSTFSNPASNVSDAARSCGLRQERTLSNEPEGEIFIVQAGRRGATSSSKISRGSRRSVVPAVSALVLLPAEAMQHVGEQRLRVAAKTVLVKGGGRGAGVRNPDLRANPHQQKRCSPLTRSTLRANAPPSRRLILGVGGDARSAMRLNDRHNSVKRLLIYRR